MIKSHGLDVRHVKRSCLKETNGGVEDTNAAGKYAGSVEFPVHVSQETDRVISPSPPLQTALLILWNSLIHHRPLRTQGS